MMGYQLTWIILTIVVHIISGLIIYYTNEEHNKLLGFGIIMFIISIFSICAMLGFWIGSILLDLYISGAFDEIIKWMCSEI